jgi:hypothetical protein
MAKVSKREVSAALRAAGFNAEEFATGVGLVPCTSGTCIDWVWSDGVQVSIPAAPHKHRRQVAERKHTAGYKLMQSRKGVIVRGVNPETVRLVLTLFGFDVELTEQYAWRAFSRTVRYDSAIVVGKAGVR